MTQPRLKTDLSTYQNKEYTPGAGKLKQILWYLTNALVFKSFNPRNKTKLYFLKLFGAQIGEGVVIKPYVNIKYPWRLTIGNNVWIGEEVWIDNIDKVIISDNACISQGALLLCGNHNYKTTGFDLITQPIIVEEGVWIGAKSIVCGGVICASHAVLTAGSVASKNLEPYTIYQGNPAIKIRERILTPHS